MSASSQRRSAPRSRLGMAPSVRCCTWPERAPTPAPASASQGRHALLWCGGPTFSLLLPQLHDGTAAALTRPAVEDDASCVVSQHPDSKRIWLTRWQARSSPVAEEGSWQRLIARGEPPAVFHTHAAPSDNWRPMVDAISGQTFYMHTVTRSTSWVHPDDLLGALPADHLHSALSKCIPTPRTWNVGVPLAE